VILHSNRAGFDAVTTISSTPAKQTISSVIAHPVTEIAEYAVKIAAPVPRVE